MNEADMRLREEKEDHDDREETQNRTDPFEDAFDDQVMERRIDIRGCKRLIDKSGKCADPHCE